MKFHSVKFKIFVLSIIIISAWLILYRGVIYINLKHTLFKEFDNQLKVKAQGVNNTIKYYLDALGDDEKTFIFAVRRAIRFEGEHHMQDKIKELEFQWLLLVNKLDLDKDYINFLDPKGRSLVSSSNMDKELLMDFEKNVKGLKDSKKEAIFTNLTIGTNLHLRIISIPFSYKNYHGYAIQVGTSLEQAILILRQQLLYNAITIPLILFIALLFAWIIVRQILKPVMEIARTAKNIYLENLSMRVKIKHADEEMEYLENAFNGMIARLEGSFKYITQFSAFVSHELKTPLAIIKGESELALKKARNIEEYKRVISVNLEETERMLKIVSDLLLLAKLEYRSEVLKFEKFDFIEFFNEICEETKVLASQKDINVNIDMPFRQIIVNGNKLHLRRLFLNLADNAVKFTPANGRIDMSVKVADAKLIVSITDTGVGIPEEDMPKLFTRFFTADKTIQESEVLHGLGLNIVQHILKIHHGDITVKSEIGKGSTFTVILPLT